MGRRRGARKEKSERTHEEREMGEEREEEEEEEEEENESNGDGFFSCYLLCSLSPRHRGHTYIGFTVNPRRRIRQHNGEMRSGAWRTKRGRPWEMVLCIYGFPTNVSALQFEWAWQHPTESLAVRQAASTFKSLAGIANKIKIAYTMLNLPAWDTLNLTVNFFSTKYMKHLGGCPKLPKQMKVNVCVMDELPCYVEGEVVDCNECDGDDSEYEEEKINEDISSPLTKSDSSGNEIGEDDCSFERQPSPPKPSASEVPIDCSFECFSGNIDSNNETEVDELLLSPLRSNAINLSTPSSCIVGKCNKRAKAYSEIIDLTDSPITIQL